jgi:hypothetical protein
MENRYPVVNKFKYANILMQTTTANTKPQNTKNKRIMSYHAKLFSSHDNLPLYPLNLDCLKIFSAGTANKLRVVSVIFAAVSTILYPE